MYTIETAKGNFQAETLEAIWAWQEEMQGAFATLVLPTGDRIDVSDCECANDLKDAIDAELE